MPKKKSVFYTFCKRKELKKMTPIRKCSDNQATHFAAEELKKYLRMMMPEGGDPTVTFAPEAKDGFRLGLLKDFGISAEEPYDPFLDDVVYIDADAEGGILAGSNPRSVLFAVYKFLFFNGCRWLYPGIDGEYVPVIEGLKPVRYCKKADYRFRGQCNEGCESQQSMLETIDYSAKVGMNVYMMEFNNPYVYYDRYYRHTKNDMNRPPEPITPETVLQYKRQCEAEISKRGLQFHDMGHGWTAEPFGYSTMDGWGKTTQDVSSNPNFKYLAEINGKRELYEGVALNTNICMSNPEARNIMSDGVVNYAATHQNVDYIHVWLADNTNNHCECAECRKKRTSDWYMILMNEIDAKLTARNLASRIVFIAYIDTLWAPTTERLRNPDRFTLLFAPITRKYTESFPEKTEAKTRPYELNKLVFPKAMDETMAYLREWKKAFTGPTFCYEYHFHLHQYFDPSLTYISKRIHEDIRVLKPNGLDGMVEDASQRSFYPNGFAMYVYAATLFDRSTDYEALRTDYEQHAYGTAWKEAREYLDAVGEILTYPHLSGNLSANENIGRYYSPEQAKKIGELESVIERAGKTFRWEAQYPARVQKVSNDLLVRHFDYCRGIAKFMKMKAEGEFEKAKAAANEWYAEFGKYEIGMERYYDHGLAVMSFNRIVREQRKESETQFS